jgi:hypothetical protein
MHILSILKRKESLKLMKKVADENKYDPGNFGDFSELLSNFDLKIDKDSEFFVKCKQCSLSQTECK